LARLRGWDVVDVYEDIDLSAYKRGIHRPSFERLQADLPGLDGVLVWRLDRLVRRPTDFERFWGRCEELGVFLASATEPVDSSSEMGVAFVRILVTFAQLESHAKSMRLKAKAEEDARRGAPPCRQGCYGHTKDWAALVPHEAELIREAARRFLGGETFSSIATSLNEEGRFTRAGNKWRDQSLKKIVTSARMVGDRSYYGAVVAKDVCPPILDRATFDEISRYFASRTRPGRFTRGLLTGWLICGNCGGRLSRHTGGRGRRSAYPGYACHNYDPDHRGPLCGVAVSGPPLDAWIEHEIVWRSRVTARWDSKLLRLVPTPVSHESWALMTLAEQRTHIDRHLVHVVVLPARGAGRWSAKRLRPTWKDDVPDAPKFAWVNMAFDREVHALGPDAITGAEFANIVGAKRGAIDYLRRKGRLTPTMKLGNRYVYSRAQAEDIRDTGTWGRDGRSS
jgi:DNA invertase Pin-like site-specific DNA recombinase